MHFILTIHYSWNVYWLDKKLHGICLILRFIMKDNCPQCDNGGAPPTHAAQAVIPNIARHWTVPCKYQAQINVHNVCMKNDPRLLFVIWTFCLHCNLFPYSVSVHIINLVLYEIIICMSLCLCMDSVNLINHLAQ